MIWRDYLAVIAGLSLLAWLRGIWPNSDEIALAVLAGVVMPGSLIRRHLRRRRFQRLEGMAASDREVAIQELPLGDAAATRLALGMTFEPDHLATLPRSRTFRYSHDSRSLNIFLFWMSIVTAGAILLPLALGRFDEVSTGVVWGIVAAILLFAAYGYRQLGREIAALLIVDEHGVSVTGTRHKDCRLGWLEISWFCPINGPGGLYRALDLRSRLGESIRFDSQMPEFDEALELVAAKLIQIRGGGK